MSCCRNIKKWAKRAKQLCRKDWLLRTIITIHLFESALSEVWSPHDLSRTFGSLQRAQFIFRFSMIAQGVSIFQACLASLFRVCSCFSVHLLTINITADTWTNFILLQKQCTWIVLTKLSVSMKQTMIRYQLGALKQYDWKKKDYEYYTGLNKPTRLINKLFLMERLVSRGGKAKLRVLSKKIIITGYSLNALW